MFILHGAPWLACLVKPSATDGWYAEHGMTSMGFLATETHSRPINYDWTAARGHCTRTSAERHVTPIICLAIGLLATVSIGFSQSKQLTVHLQWSEVLVTCLILLCFVCTGILDLVICRVISLTLFCSQFLVYVVLPPSRDYVASGPQSLEIPRIPNRFTCSRLQCFCVAFADCQYDVLFRLQYVLSVYFCVNI